MDEDELVQNLKQMVLGFEPHIHAAGSVDEVDETLHRLEENEQYFHRFEFVKQLKRTIDDNLGVFIDEEIDKCNMGAQNGATGQEPLVNRITERVIHSMLMSDLMGDLKKSVTSASDHLIDNFDTEFGPTLLNEDAPRYQRQFSGDDDTSYVSSLNQPGSLMFMDSDRRERLLEDLAKTRPFEVRREALRQVNSLPAGELVHSDQWPIARKGILDALNDSEPTLAWTSLKFVMQAFSTTSPRTADIFSLLVEFLIVQFTSRKNVMPSLKQGLDIRRPELNRIVKAFRLLNEFQCEAPFYWVRYPERYLQEVLESSLNLFCLHPSHSISPLHIISLLDMKASWFKRWMHGGYSRSHLLSLLHKYKPLLEDAVRCCFQFISTYTRDRQTPLHDSHIGRDFTGPVMEYAYFLHSVHLLVCLISYKHGRHLFPIILQDRQDPVTISDFLKTLISVVTDNAADRAHDSGAWSPCHVITELFKQLCYNDEVYMKCLCDDQWSAILIHPLQQSLCHTHEKCEEYPSEETLLRVADILSVIASSNTGRHHLLFGQNRSIFSKTKSSAATVIVNFTAKALVNDLPDGSSLPISKSVIGEFLYICRQLYNTCEGLHMLYPFHLHVSLTKSLQQVCDELDKAETPTPGDEWPVQSNNPQIIWEETLRDNLLNFAATAKGILLLQQSGMFNDCVTYLSERYSKKVQVGKYERFGYGYMVTQVAATAPGMVALQQSGLIQTLLDELWSVLECGGPDIPSVTPRMWPVDPIDRLVQKPFIRVLNILSSFPAVYEALFDQSVPVQETYSLRQGPRSIASLIDRLVLLNTPAKIRSLFNFEQSHVCGLRLLSVIISCLDTQLLLHSQYQYQEVLLKAQGENTPQHRNDVIIDMLSVERNYILVKSFVIGGPSERVLPPRTLNQHKVDVYPYPLFSSYPVPREYTPNVTGRAAMKQGLISSKQFVSQDNDLSRLLAESKKKPEKNNDMWLEKCRSALHQVLPTKPELCKGNAIQYLLEQCVSALCNTEEAVFPHFEISGKEKSVRSYKLSPLQQAGVTMAVRYGSHLKLFTSQSEASSGLTQLLKLTGTALQQQHKLPETTFKFYSGTYPGFDWFVATIFLLFNGSLDRAWKFLQKFATLNMSAYLWSPRLHLSRHIPSKLLSSAIPPVFCRTGHNVELILQTEFPIIAAAFKMSGYSPAQLCSHWLRQCFWNYLDWLDICHYVGVVTCLGVDYQVYVCVAILHHLQTDICRHMQQQDLIIYLKEGSIGGFRLGRHLPFMKTLEEKYRRIILQDMLNFSKP